MQKTQKQRGRKPLNPDDKKRPVTVFVKQAIIAQHGGMDIIKQKINKLIYNETTTI